MKNIEKRLQKLQQKQEEKQVLEQPEFIDWTGNPWTEEEKLQVLRGHPDCNRFYKGMAPNVPLYPPHWGDKPVLRLPDGTHYITGQRRNR